jgi:hypothetical protein
MTVGDGQHFLLRNASSVLKEINEESTARIREQRSKKDLDYLILYGWSTVALFTGMNCM